MGQKAKNSGKKKSKTSTGKLASTKSVSCNISSKNMKICPVDDLRVYEAMGIDPRTNLCKNETTTSGNAAVGINFSEFLFRN
tara:strand:- start:59 stop:304 length:246 start_codon:yes stop_codon:yes gene_type:complete